MVYMDYNATSPVRQCAIDAVKACMYGRFGNPSSTHLMGITARDSLDARREMLADIIGAKPEEIIFTSGGTESNNLAIFGYMMANSPGKGLAVSQIEHKSVLRAAQVWSVEDRVKHADGGGVWEIGVTEAGFVSVECFTKLVIDNETMLAAVMLANNETGAIQPITAIRELATAYGVDLHVDACQALGKIPVNVDELGAGMMSMSAHKIGGPAGIGALYVRDGIEIAPRMVGGHQERDLRAGTENVAGAIGFVTALQEARDQAREEWYRLLQLREQLQEGIARTIPETVRNHPDLVEDGLPHVLNYSFPGADNELLVTMLSENEVYVSTGSACDSGTLAPSYVLTAMGRDEEVAGSAIRFSFGWNTRESDIDVLLAVLPPIIEDARKAAAY